ncbi:MAG: hypothetical protein A3F15_00120 [Candidatus Wildermuthbacteria bacterium RIFCSPHIGHO2_12_FULL_40_12]|uniref:Uncharacterized protein n=1 Tax=Candidatus Wildermuthbacteria bacterium RIFCSPHIGHO2_12_FULL_40_12 TaxID=1802457 RepID=A0A1G2RF96_9BACT|nr:MAG: hypothetical protein A3F15_00120 [Candidatus Wildermuthbacteria bacterium RIFCSPHIGHO2_12_FULL_40_12]
MEILVLGFIVGMATLFKMAKDTGGFDNHGSIENVKDGHVIHPDGSKTQFYKEVYIPHDGHGSSVTGNYHVIHSDGSKTEFRKDRAR